MSRHISYWSVWVILFGGTLFFPTFALIHLSQKFGPLYVCAYIFIISVSTFVLYRSDKNRAKNELSRIPERTLHLFELAGGWIAAFWAQRILRHKIRKPSYQFSFWSIILLHQYLAYDYLANWHTSLKLFAYATKAFAVAQPYLQ